MCVGFEGLHAVHYANKPGRDLVPKQVYANKNAHTNAKVSFFLLNIYRFWNKNGRFIVSAAESAA